MNDPNFLKTSDPVTQLLQLQAYSEESEPIVLYMPNLQKLIAEVTKEIPIQ